MLHGVAFAVVVAGLAAEVVRPLAAPEPNVAEAAVLFREDFARRAAAYRGPLYVAAAAGLAVRTLVPVLAVVTPAGRRLLAAATRRLAPRPALAAAVGVVAVLAATEVAVLPIGWYAGYVHEGAWGFRTQGLAGWFGDRLLAVGPLLVLGGLAGAGGLWLARRQRVPWAPVAGLVAAAATFALTLVGPLVLEPLRYRFTPLPPGPDRAAVEAVLARAGSSSVQDLLVADASRRTTKHNAYVSGLGATRRVVLYDTLLANRPAPEVAAVFAHELGHDQHGDLWRQAAFGAAGSVLAAYAIAAVWTRSRAVADPAIAAVTALAVVSVLACLSLPVQQAASRRAEAAADAAALELTADPATFVRMQQGLARANLNEPLPPRWAYMLWSSHPAPAERVARGLAWSP